jgi:transposase
MAKYRSTDVGSGQGLFLSVNLQEQLLPGTFEHMLNEIIGTKINLNAFDGKYKNDLTGASAVPPSALLKLIFYGYFKGSNSSRKLYELNNNNIIAKALTGDMHIHWTVIADFISGNKETIKETFSQVLLYCNELGLIGGENFAVDGLRLPSNASLEMSGTEKQLGKRIEVYRRMASKHIERHARRDAQGINDEGSEKRFKNRQKQLALRIEKINQFLETMEKKEGRNGAEIQSNVTDNESAMIHSSKGYIQGYVGIAIADQKSQIITSAQAFGSANETEHLPEMLDRNAENLEEAGVKRDAGKKPTMSGDANYFSDENLRSCEEHGIDAVLADSQGKRRIGSDGESRYELDDFNYHEAEDYYECPAGKRLTYRRDTKQMGIQRKVYQASLTDCKRCPVFSKCSWSRKEQSAQVQGKALRITERNKQSNACRQMRKKFETVEYQDIYAYRIQIVEPVFANIRYCKRLNRFTLRGKDKVNSQWLLYCMVHKLSKCLKAHKRREGYE